MKICKDCRWCKSSWWSGKECLHPKSLEIDVVTGGRAFHHPREMRWGDCGSQGVLWESAALAEGEATP